MTPVPLSRREFLRSSAAVAAVAAGGSVLAGCGRGQTSVADQIASGGIATISIHPSIGVGRVGNSPDLMYFGPEVPGALPAATAFKDGDGALARQAARYRVFGLDAAGDVVAEITEDSDIEIEWTVHVANKKAAWYEFTTAMNLPAATAAPRRNPDVTGSDRDQLVMYVERSVSGAGAAPERLTGADFLGVPTDLGEISTDGEGRLVVLPGNGEAYRRSGASLSNFSENPGYSDSICDGAVLVTIRVDGRTLTAAPAWFVATPPNYSPGIDTGLISAYDQARSALVAAGVLSAPASVEYWRDIAPLFSRQAAMAATNAGYLEQVRPGGALDFAGDLSRLADPAATDADERRSIFERYRPPDESGDRIDAFPYLWGDAIAIPPDGPNAFLTVTQLQYDMLARWADGEFVPGEASAVESIDDVDVADRPRLLDEASLTSMLGGANHPGIEVPWTVGIATMWSEPFRLAVQGVELDIRDYGDELTPEVAMSADGPVNGVTPGDLSMWMGVPWQGDAGSCRAGYRTEGFDPPVSPYLPAFWPARVPNQVLTETNYDVVMDRDAPIEERRRAFGSRRDWLRNLNREPTIDEQLETFADQWALMGVVAARPGPSDTDEFGASINVETDVGYDEPPLGPPGDTNVCASSPEIVCQLEP